MTATIDIGSLFISLLTIALLQEFIIKPGVDFVKRYYHKSRKHVENVLRNNEVIK